MPEISSTNHYLCLSLNLKYSQNTLAMSNVGLTNIKTYGNIVRDVDIVYNILYSK